MFPSRSLRFCDGLREVNFQGNVTQLWSEIDEDGSGEITLEEIDAEANDVPLAAGWVEA